MKAVIFDMDGVIIDSRPVHFAAYCDIFRNEFNIQIEDDESWFGKGARFSVPHFLNKYGLNADVVEITEKKRIKFEELYEQVDLIKDVDEFIKILVSNGMKVGLATAARRHEMAMAMNKFNLYHYFDSILALEDVENMKPHPETYLRSLNHLNVSANECLAFEDSPVGIEAAKRAGIKCIGITTSYKRELLIEVDLIIDSYQEIDIVKLNKL